MNKFNQHTFKEQLFMFLKIYHYKEENLKVWEKLRVHHIFNELYEAVQKSRKDRQWNLKTY